ncbi:MAG: CHC2 zinc finger domain-containing protein [bacterium]
MSSDRSRGLIETVRLHTDIVDVISQFVTLNHQNKALCPFHKEKTPSFSVNSREQYFYCFGCGVGGDVFRFLELYQNRPFWQILVDLAGQAGIAVPTLTDEGRQDLHEERSIEDILTETAQFYHHSLTPKARQYLVEERGLSEDTIARFQIGFANGSLRQHLLDERHESVDLCLKAGVLTRTDSGIRDYFYHRIIFPNIRRGRVVHLSGRSLDEQKPKYLHLPGGIRYLYNEDALSGEVVYIAEGIPDCLSAVQEGYPAVGTYGSYGFKPEYAERFSYCETVYLCLDGDQAGLKGALKIGEIIGERAKIVQLPQGLDLNDYFRDNTKDDFDSLVASATGIIKFELSQIPSDTDKIELPRKLEPILLRLSRMDKAAAEAYLSYKIKDHFNLKKTDIDGYRDIVNKHRKAEAESVKAQTSDSDTEPVYTAYFDGLVDLVEHDGSPAFLIKEADNLTIAEQVEREGTVYIPPKKTQIPWLLPRGEEVLKYCKTAAAGLSHTECDATLYDALVAYHKAISELPGTGGVL